MKKLLFFGAALLVLLLATLSLFNSNNVVNALTINLFTVEEGDLIKVDGDSAVYRVGSDLKKHLFVNGVTFWTHYNGDWSNIKDNGTAIVIKSYYCKARKKINKIPE